MLRVLCSILLVLAALDSAAAYNHFIGGTFSFSVRNDSNGNLVSDLDLITGWVLGKGPCGPGCNKTDLHRSTLDSRRATIARLNDPLHFGNWTSEFKLHHITSTRDLNHIINSDMKEEVLAMNTMAKWEQEWLQVTVPLETHNEELYEDIYVEGQNWHNLTFQPQVSSWKLQAKIDSRIRSDTLKPNQSPKVLMKPFYRIKLNTIGRINIAATDPDGDYVDCKHAVASEASDIADNQLPGLTLHENCTVVINTSSALGYRDDSWGAVALSVGDHNKEKVNMGEETLRPYETGSLSKTAVQFLVQVLAALNAPEFVKPTADQNHHFILYAGTTWVQKIYAKSSENTTIDQFIVIGRQREQLIQSDPQDGSESGVKFIELKWTPTAQEVGNHIICITAVDNTGVDTVEDRCFTVEIRPDRFNHTTKVTPFLVQVLAALNAPEFVKPTADQNHHFILYAGTTWVQKIYAKSSENTTIDHFIVIGRQREQLIQSDLQDGSESGVKFIEFKWTPTDQEVGNHIICITAVDNTGVDTVEDRCFTVEIRPDRFNHTTKVTPGRPYFVDIPVFEQTIQCLRDVTCTVPIYVVSPEPVDKISVTESYFKTTSCGPISKETHNGQQVYKSDLSFSESVDGTKKICLIAYDTAGKNSDETCIQSKLDPPDPCASNPCRNSAECVRSLKDPLAFTCRCLNEDFSGKYCENKRDQCNPNPCVHGEMCLNILPDYACLCHGYFGKRCEIQEDKCTQNPCGSRGICETKNGEPECNCFDRFSGVNCTTDQCPGVPVHQLTCSSSCVCNGQGVCGARGKCSCKLGYRGATCGLAIRSAENLFNVTGTMFVPPSPNQASTIRCYISRPCTFSVFASTSECVVPAFVIDSVSAEIASSTVSSVTEAQYIPGLQHLYTADVHVNGGSKVGTSYMCLNAEAGGSTDRLCVQISYETDPVDEPSSLEASQEHAMYKFISPTPKADSNFICYVNEDCRMMLHTNLVTQCEQVVSADMNVTVFPTSQISGSCVTEVLNNFSTENSVHVCFKSSLKPSSQTRCFNIDVFNKFASPCVFAQCLNDGDCLLAHRNASYCLCKDGYSGDKCEKGPCKRSDNSCDPDAFCYDGGNGSYCICPLGMTGALCTDRSTANIQGSKFTDTAMPVKVACIVNRPCNIPLAISSSPSSIEVSFSFGFVSHAVQTVGITTEPSLTGSMKATVSVIPLEVGQKTVCVQTHTAGVNDDELCIQVYVTMDSSFLYGYHDRPSFIMPSLPANAEVKCPADKYCHVLYHVTTGYGHSRDCATVLFSKAPYEHRHIFSSCSNCTEGIGSTNCSLDVSFIPPASEIGKTSEVCLEVQLTRSHFKGEERCFKVTVATNASMATMSGCQKLHCKNGGFCDSRDVANPVCFCSPGYTGATCATNTSGTGTSPTKATFINNFGVPKALNCHVNRPCSVNFHMTGPTCPKPTVSLGYTSPGLFVTNQPSIVTQDGTEYIGTASVTSTRAGIHNICVQTGQSGTVHDEMCLTVNFLDHPGPSVDKSKPHFVDPTPSADSTVLCQTGIACYIEVYYDDDADPVGAGDICPRVDDTSPTYTAGVHIFGHTLLNSTCRVTISYVPQTTANGQQKTVCIQVLLPGKYGEDRCFNIDVTNDIDQAVISPCRNKTCSNGGKCIANLASNIPTSVCVCPKGWKGAQCEIDESMPISLHGSRNARSLPATSHFVNSAGIPTEIACVINVPCIIPIPYQGIDPPVLDYVDPFLKPGTPEVVYGSAVTEVTSAKAGTHRMCLHTATGVADGEEKVCVDVKILPGKDINVNKTLPYFKPETIPGNSTVVCNTNSGCHVPMLTQPFYGNCPLVSECPPGVPGVHIFDTRLNNGVCVTDAAIATGTSATIKDLCVSAGPGGEERHVTIMIKPLTGF